MTVNKLKEAKYRLDYRAPEFTIPECSLDFQLDPENTRVKQVSHVKRSPGGGKDLVLDGEDLRLESVLVNGSPADYTADDVSLTVRNVPDDFTLEIVNYISPKSNTSFEGLYMSEGHFCSQNEAQGFRHITYFLDRPDISCKFTSRVEADEAEYPYLLVNGNRKESGKLPGGRHYVVREMPMAMPCYLYALIAGKFDIVRDTFTTKSGKHVDLELYVNVGDHDRGLHAIASLKKAMKWDEDRFGFEYDLELYQIVCVDFYNMGAMENKGLNVFNSRDTLADPRTATDFDFFNIEGVIGHEYFHNWTGDRVTLRDWFQLCLKEGLTVFRDQEFSSDVESRPMKRLEAVRVITGPQFDEDAGPMTHPIRPDYVMEMNNFYTVTVYDKGAEVFRMLHTILGEEKFQKGMKLYISRFDCGCATCDDILKAMSDASGIDLTDFSRWFSQSGTPRLKVRSRYDQKEKKLYVSLDQMTPPDRKQPEKQPLVLPLRISFISRNGGKLPIKESSGAYHDGVLLFDKAHADLVFEDLPERPVCSWLDDFSAPVRLDAERTSDDLLTLVRYSEDPCTRKFAAVDLFKSYVRENVKNAAENRQLSPASDIVAAMRSLLSDEKTDKQLLAEILRLPTEQEMGSYLDTIDTDAVHAVRKHLAAELAHELFDEWLACYRSNHLTKPYEWNLEDAGHRAIANCALGYLAVDDPSFGSTIAQKQYRESDNMTDTLAAMRTAANLRLACADDLIRDFSEKWKGNGLVMDNCFRIVAGVAAEDTLSKVRKLMETSPDFRWDNPNRVRALAGTFIMANPYAFNDISGCGYDFMTEVMEKLNDINPQTGARIFTPWMFFRRLDSRRQEMIRSRLEKMQNMKNISPDLYEKIKNALAG